MSIKLKTTATLQVLDVPSVQSNGSIKIPINKVEIDLSNKTIESGLFGEFVSKAFAVDALSSYVTEHQTSGGCVKNNVKRVFFSREVIDLILSQEECQGISIYFVYPPKKSVIDNIVGGGTIMSSELDRQFSLLLIGNDITGKPLADIENTPLLDTDDTIITEVGGHDPPSTEVIPNRTGIEYFI